LGHWLITPSLVDEIDSQSSNGFNSSACIDAEPEYRKAVITIAEKVWDELTPLKKNRTICHEMLHATLSPYQVFMDGLIDELPPSKRAVYKKWWRSVDETMVEHFCNVMLEASGELKGSA